MSAESILRDKADLVRKVGKLPPDLIYLAQREAGTDLQSEFNVLRYKYQSLRLITKGWSDIMLTVEYSELTAAEPLQESLF